MNSKKEYNRCYMPEISIKKDEKDEKKDPMLEAEDSALEIIRKMQPTWKKRTRNRQEKLDENTPKKASKRAKIDGISEEKAPIKLGCNANFTGICDSNENADFLEINIVQKEVQKAEISASFEILL